MYSAAGTTPQRTLAPLGLSPFPAKASASLFSTLIWTATGCLAGRKGLKAGVQLGKAADLLQGRLQPVDILLVRCAILEAGEALGRCGAHRLPGCCFLWVPYSSVHARGAPLRCQDAQEQAEGVQDQGLGCSWASVMPDTSVWLPCAHTGRMEVKVGEGAEEVRLGHRKGREPRQCP